MENKLYFWSMHTPTKEKFFKYESLQTLSKTKFRPYTGLNPETFEIMVLIVNEYMLQTKEKDGRPCNLSIEDQLLLLLEYYWENHNTNGD
jgi:hypothetical protein